MWDRKRELAALAELEGDGGLAVIWGRRRIGKTRLLLAWSQRGVYTVADQSAPHLQRAYFARAISQVLPGFADVTYPDWERLLSRLAADAIAAGFTGPLVIDELPYLVASSPELPSILQRWLDHDARRARLRVALAGSSQRMMQGLVLSHAAPLYGRARVTLDLAGLGPEHLHEAFGRLSPSAAVQYWAAFGGVPRYWELAAQRRGPPRERLIALALDPLGPLFAEPDRLLLEESPPAVELRPVLDAIGAGAHRLSEIAGRLGRPATSLGHALDRLMGMTLVRREVPYGESAKGGDSRRALAPAPGSSVGGPVPSRCARAAWPAGAPRPVAPAEPLLARCRPGVGSRRRRDRWPAHARRRGVVLAAAGNRGDRGARSGTTRAAPRACGNSRSRGRARLVRSGRRGAAAKGGRDGPRRHARGAPGPFEALRRRPLQLDEPSRGAVVC
jgi:AAA+ ATPase superfamily predicted ATPase